jgi:thiamine-phosphate pyrophosphorylase
MNNFDLSLYLVTDQGLSMGRTHEFIVEQAVKGGVSMVQLREKDISSRDFFHSALSLKNLLKPFNIPLIINDRLDIALAVNADGLHIGQSDIPYNIARKILGPDMIIGLSVENILQAKEANNFDVDYIGISPVFSTNTKTDTSLPLGLEGVREIATFTNHQTVAIGGINISNAAEIIANGADGLAVVSAIVSHNKPEIAAAELRSIIDEQKRKK